MGWHILHFTLSHRRLDWAHKAALLVFVFGSFGILIPSPGGMGTYHALVVKQRWLSFTYRAMTHSAMPILSFSTSRYFTTIVFGILSLLYSCRSTMRHYIPNHFSDQKMKSKIFDSIQVANIVKIWQQQSTRSSVYQWLLRLVARWTCSIPESFRFSGW